MDMIRFEVLRIIISCYNNSESPRGGLVNVPRRTWGSSRWTSPGNLLVQRATEDPGAVSDRRRRDGLTDYGEERPERGLDRTG